MRYAIAISGPDGSTSFPITDGGQAMTAIASAIGVLPEFDRLCELRDERRVAIDLERLAAIRVDTRDMTVGGRCVAPFAGLDDLDRLARASHGAKTGSPSAADRQAALQWIPSEFEDEDR